MTHDPLCPSSVFSTYPNMATINGATRPVEVVVRSRACECDLIARVRADQTKRDIERAEVGLMGCLTTTRDRVIGMIQEAS